MKSSNALKQLWILVLISAFSCQLKQEAPNIATPENNISEFLGQWTFDIGPNQVGWLEVRQENGFIDADMLWIGGSVVPVPYVYMAGNRLMVGRHTRKEVRAKDENGNELHAHVFPAWVEFKSEGENLTGWHLSPKSSGLGLDTIAITGKKLPDVPPAPDLTSVKYGEPVHLLGSHDLTGWRLVEPNNPNGWSVVDGVLINDPVQPEGEAHIYYGNLRTDAEFEDFKLELEVNVPARSNSGIYLRGRHEIQVSDSYGSPLNKHNMGALYSRITPSVNAEKPAGEWQTMEIILCDRHLTVILNGTTIIDNKPVYGPTGGALTSDVYAPGPLYLQGDHGKIMYRNMVLTPILK
jgi:hypothetical protein